MENYKELRVWQEAMDLVTEIYRLGKTLPPEERFGLKSQMERSAVSIPVNIAEGWGRGTTKEYIQFLRIARGSLMELETLVLIANNLGIWEKTEVEETLDSIRRIGMMLNSLISSFRNK